MVKIKLLSLVIRSGLIRGTGLGYWNLSYQLNFRPFLSYQLNFRPFLSYQLISTNLSYDQFWPNAKWFRNHLWYNPRKITTSRGNNCFYKPFSFSKEISYFCDFLTLCLDHKLTTGTRLRKTASHRHITQLDNWSKDIKN